MLRKNPRQSIATKPPRSRLPPAFTAFIAFIAVDPVDPADPVDPVDAVDAAELGM